MSGCGPFGSDSDSGSGQGPSATELTITVQPKGPPGPTSVWTLRCEPIGGNHPRAEAACEQLTAESLEPLPPDTVCTQIYGGPEVARVSGTFRGRQVDSRFSRTNGCEIHRWDELGPVLAPA
jgi:Subtilisin inhibitor-like